jgi:hypothetical protein
VKIQVDVFWVVTQCSVVVGYQHFRGLCRLHLQGEDGGVTLYPTVTIQGVTTQKTASSIPVIKFNLVIFVSVMSVNIHLITIIYTKRKQQQTISWGTIHSAQSQLPT